MKVRHINKHGQVWEYSTVKEAKKTLNLKNAYYKYIIESGKKVIIIDDREQF